MNASPSSLPVADPAHSTRLDHLALIAVRGADARTFLDSQLTRNVPPAAPPGGQAAVAMFGYCSPKGRLLANGLVWAEDDTIALLISRDIAEAVAKRLRMYVLRAKATLDDGSTNRRIDGVIDGRSLPPLEPWSAQTIDGVTWLRYPDLDGRARHLRIGSADDAPGDQAMADPTVWRWMDVRAGLPRIGAGTQDRFVPQMLNLEALGAVDFKKGCYPGQEIVARSQYLGKLKRRMSLASLESSAAVPLPGTDVWTAGDHEPCGIVVNAERGPDGRVALLVELPLAQVGSALHLQSPDGPALTLEPLPYALPDNEVFVRPKL